MNKYEIVGKIEAFAPLETQEPWDASGWIVDLPSETVNKVLFALTVTPNVFEQAKKLGCDLIISHHPLFFVPFEYRTINIYCAHTNLDKAKGGTTDLILNALRLEGTQYNEFVRIVEFENEMSIEYLKLKLLPISPHLRCVNNFDKKTVKKVAFCAGSGSDFINSTPCDAFVTGDLKYHTAVESNKILFDIGHFESEIMSTRLLKDITSSVEGMDIKGFIANEESPFI